MSEEVCWQFFLHKFIVNSG